MATVNAWIDDIVHKHFVPSIKLSPTSSSSSSVSPASSLPPLSSSSSAPLHPNSNSRPASAAAIRDSLDILADSDESFIASLQQALKDADASLQNHRSLGLSSSSSSSSTGKKAPRLTVDSSRLSASFSANGAVGLVAAVNNNSSSSAITTNATPLIASSQFLLSSPSHSLSRLRKSQTSIEGLRASFSKH